MRYWVYPHPLQGATGCLIVPEGTSLGSLPANIQARYAGAQPRRVIQLKPGVRHAGLEVSEALRDIGQKGYYIGGIDPRTIDQWPGEPAGV